MSKYLAALIRHGDYHQLEGAPSAHQPFALNTAGESHARAAGLAIREMLDRHQCVLSSEVDSSRLLRAWQTAEIMMETLHERFTSAPKHFEYDELAERGVGSAANLTTQQIEQIIRDDPRYSPLPPDWKSRSRFRLPLQGAESLMEAGERVARHIRQRMRQLSQYADENTLKLFVGHGAAFRHAAHHLGILEFDDIAKLSMYHGQPLLFEYSGETVWRHIDGEWKIRGTEAFRD